MKQKISEAHLNASGIYSIRNTINNKVYIGSALCFSKRFAQHKHDLLEGKHNKRLQNFVNKYGIDSLYMECLELCDPESLLTREQFWIDYFEAFKSKKGFNVCRVAGSTLGVKMPESHKKACRERMKGNQISLGRKHSLHTKEEISNNSKAMWLANREKMLDAVRENGKQRKGKPIWQNKPHPNLGKQSPCRGQKRDEEFRALMRECRKRNTVVDDINSKVVALIDTNGCVIKTYKSQACAAQSLGLDSAAIGRVCKGEYKHTKGYVFRWI